MICADCGNTSGFDCTCLLYQCDYCQNKISIAELEFNNEGFVLCPSCFNDSDVKIELDNIAGREQL